MHRFFLKSSFSSANKDIVGSDVKHISKVLRLSEGDVIEVVDSKGCLATAIIQRISKEKISLNLKEIIKENQKNDCKIIFGQALLKGEKMDMVIQKTVELGVTDIVPLALSRSIVSYDDKKEENKRKRWQKIADSAAKQSKRHDIPFIHNISTLEDALKSFKCDLGIVFFEEEKNVFLKNIIRNNKEKPKTIFLIIGPEGGLEEEEVILAKSFGFRVSSLGDRILRAETAGIASLAMVMYEFYDMGQNYE